MTGTERSGLAPRRIGGGAAKMLLVSMAVLGVLYWTFGRGSALEPANLVGRWKSTRTQTPFYLHANGEWEIRREDKVLEYGVWRLERGSLIWTYKDGSGYRDDINPVLSTGRDQFQLRETDGSVTTFMRLGDIP
jgi:hypothetical protein